MQAPDETALVAVATCISDLVVGQRGQVLEAMVYRKWIAKSLPDMTETDYVCMLIDHKGNAVHATMDRNNLTYFDDLLVLGQVYRISCFSCANTSSYQQSIQNPVTLRFGKIAKFDLLEGKEDGWPQHYFEFVPFRELSSRVPYKDANNKTVYPLLTDYIGRIRYIGDLPSAGNVAHNKGLRRKIDIENLDGTVVELTLWDEAAAHFPKAFTDTLPAPVIIAVSSCRVMKYKGALQLSAMPATHCYVNPETSEAAILLAAFREKFKTTPPLQVSKKRFGPSDVQDPTQTQTLGTLLRHPPSGFKGVKFVLQAMITGVVENRSWYYVSCPECKKQPEPYDGVYECEDHGELEGPSFRYNFSATVNDGTAGATFTFFSPAGDEITGHPCSELAAKYTTADRRVVPEEITGIVGKRHTFQVQFGGSSAIGSGRFNVTAILDKAITVATPIQAIEAPPPPHKSAVTVHIGKIEQIETSEEINAGAHTGTHAGQQLATGTPPVLGSSKGNAVSPEATVDAFTTTVAAASKPNEAQTHRRPVRRSILPQLQEDAKKARNN